MMVEVLLPQWGMGMEDGTITKWLKAEGDHVELGDQLVEVDTAKVSNIVESPARGTLKRILAAEGATVPVRHVLGTIESDD